MSFAQGIVDRRVAEKGRHQHRDKARPSIGSIIVMLEVISVTNTRPVKGARTMPVNTAAIPTIANPSG